MSVKLPLLFFGTIVFSFFFMKEKNNVVWNDEFNYSGLPDSTKWSYQIGDGCPELCGWGNNELQVYTDGIQNAYVKDGRLIIEAHSNDSSYTSARIVSTNKGYWKYGRVEVRAKLPTGIGTWPAIWMLPVSSKYGKWPKSGEIDIMEHVGYELGKIHGTVHTESFNHLAGTQKGKAIDLVNVDNEFHIYAIEWNEQGISFLADGNQYNYFPNTNNNTYKEWPFDEPFYLILNIAVGGDWGGRQGVDKSIWPQRMEIDYVRIYKL